MLISFNTDPLNAMAISDYARVGKISGKPWQGADYMPLQRLTRQRLHIAVNFVIHHGKNRFKNPMETAKLLQKAARDSYRLDKALSDPLNVAIAMPFDQIKFLEKQLKAIDKVIERTVKGLSSNEYTCIYLCQRYWTCIRIRHHC